MHEARWYYSVAFSQKMTLAPAELDIEYIVPWQGTILAACDTGEVGDEPEVPVGRVLGYRIHAGRAISEGDSLFDVCDAHSAIMAECYDLLFNRETGEFRDEIERQFPDALSTDVLLIDLVTILPQHRGKSIGIAAVRRALDLIDSSGSLVVCKPYPLQYDAVQRSGHKVEERSQLQLDQFEVPEQEAFDKLQRYWSQLGFKRIGDSRYMGMCTAYVHPALRDLNLDL